MEQKQMHPIDLLLYNAKIITMNKEKQILDSGYVAVNENKIIDMGNGNVPEDYFQANKIIDVSDKVLTPGFINTHTHIFQTFLRGFGQDLPAINWLHAAIDPSVKHIETQEAYYSAYIGCLEAIKCGTTTLLEYNYANPVPNIGDHVISAYTDAGLRGIYARGILDCGDLHKDVIQPLESELDDFERLFHKYQDNEMISIWLAPYTIMSASEKAFIKSRELADKYQTWITVHAATPSTIESARTQYGMGDIEWEEQIGFLKSDVLAVHCCGDLTPKDLEILAKHDVKISHNPVSNCYLGEGIAKVREMVDVGLCVGLATDGPGSNNNHDMVSTLKITALLQKVKYEDPTAMNAYKVLEMATIDGARAIGKETTIGSIEIGKYADLVIFDLNLLNTSFSSDPIASIVYSATQENVDTVIIDGKVRLENRNINGADEKKVIQKAKPVFTNFISKSGIK